MTAVRLGPDHDLAKRLSTLEQKVQQLSTRDLLQNASIGAGGLSVNSGGAITINGGGSMSVNGGGNIDITGGSINVSNGSVAVTGAGEMTVDGLKLSAVSAATVQAYGSGFSVGTSATAVASTKITVPSGYSTALIFATGQAEFANSAGGANELQAYLSFSESAGSATTTNPATDIAISPGATSTLTVGGSCLVTGLSGSGQTVTVSGDVLATTSIGASSYNVFAISGLAVFLA